MSNSYPDFDESRGKPTSVTFFINIYNKYFIVSKINGHVVWLSRGPFFRWTLLYKSHFRIFWIAMVGKTADVCRQTPRRLKYSFLTSRTKMVSAVGWRDTVHYPVNPHTQKLRSSNRGLCSTYYLDG